MADDIKMWVNVEARLRDFEKNFAKASRTSDTQFKNIEQRAKRSATQLEQIMGGAASKVNGILGNFAGGFMGGFLGAGGLQKIIEQVGKVAEGVASIGDKAKQAGLSTKSFQELSFVADQNRISVDALTDGMKELSLRADEFLFTGGGPAAEAFKRLGFSASDLKERLKDPSALLVEIIARLEQLDSASRIRITDEIFGGTAGERFVQLVDQGSSSIRQMIDDANRLGLVLDESMIQRADEIDRKYKMIAATVNTKVKTAIVGVASLMSDWMDSFNKLEEQQTRTIQLSLSSIYERMQEAKRQLEELELDKIAFPEDITIDLNIDRQKQHIEELAQDAMRLRDVLDRRNGYSESFVYKAGEEAAAAKPPIVDLNAALSGTDTAAGRAVANINSFADAIRALKQEVPELSKSLQDLDKKAQIDAVYQKAIAKAQGQREIALANEMRGKALASLNLKSATDDPTTYLSSMLASGKSKNHIAGMESAFSKKLATMLASMPDDLKGSVTINSGFRSIERQQELWLQALQKYGSPEAARQWVAPPGNSQHNKGNAADLGYGSDAARNWVHQNAPSFGLSFPLKNENWHIEDASARSRETAAEIERLTQAATQQSEAYRQITAGAREFTTAQETERQALSMTGQAASAFRFEQEMLNQAQREGISLTPQQRAEIQGLAQDMAQAEQATLQYAESQQQAQQAMQFFGGLASDIIGGLINGTLTAEEALQRLASALAEALLQAALLGQGPLAGLFGTGGGMLGGIGSMMGFASGGAISGPGTSTSDSIPILASNGEFMVRASQARKHRPLLEAINSGRVGAFASGGSVGNAGGGLARSIAAPTSNTFAPVTNITVEGGSRGEEADQELAGKISQELDMMMEHKMQAFAMEHMRPGGLFNNARFG